MRDNFPAVLSIAGSDPSGGAGIQADLKTFAAHHCYGMAVITSLTAQNTLGVQAIYTPPPEFLKQQLEAVFEDIPPKAVKIGMLPDQATMEIVGEALNKYKPRNIILDPVMVATSGDVLQEAEAVSYLKEVLCPLATLITPNKAESKILNITDFSVPVLLKGGHEDSNQSDDILYEVSGETVFTVERIETKNTHGTGCTLSSAIAANMAHGLGLHEAISKAKDYVTQAIMGGKDLNLGAGHGPLYHGVYHD